MKWKAFFFLEKNDDESTSGTSIEEESDDR